ncbi:DUF5047 domain-containing protein [Streptomyces sp. NPDC055085]
MQTATREFFAGIAASHTVFSYVKLVTPRQQVFTLTATDGSVQADRTAVNRRRMSVTAVDPTGQLTPAGLESALSPGGSELRAYRGLIYESGLAEVVPLGVFRISDVTITDDSTNGVKLQAEGYDRSWAIGRSKFELPYVIAPSTSIISAVKGLITRTYPDTDFDVTGSSLTTTAPIVFDAGKDPWEAATGLAASIGREVYFDVDGTCIIAPAPDIDALPSPVWSFIEGPKTGNLMTDLQRKLTSNPGYNGVIVVGHSPADSQPPVRAEAWDNMPGSPTYYLGDYGRVPVFIQDQNVKTTSDAQARADAELNKYLGFASQLSVNASVNPALDVGDCVRVERAASRVSGLFLVDALTIPFTNAGKQGITLRQRRVA